MFISIELRSINSWISIKISTRFIAIMCVAEWTSRLPPQPMVCGSIPRGGKKFVFLEYFQKLISTSEKKEDIRF